MSADVVIRAIGVADAGTVTQHRHRMFVDAGKPDDAALAAMSEAFLPWVRAKLEAGQYFGWFAEAEGRVVSGIGMMAIEWPPHPLHLEPLRGYILNVYTEPEWRGRGLAKRLTGLAMDAARERGLNLTILHATEMGKSLYAKLGFKGTNEMQWSSKS
ncbi:MAG TPA: GNAT family N-acetyltransferase [Gammaproteobacteria bacterium]|jgi:ribosomal protein S18 acetylase RimI-like enzyme